MNTIDTKYQELLQDILDNGVEKGDRTGTGTISVFGRQIRHKMSQGFPLLTTKKMAWKTMVVELLWFLRGDTNIKFLLDYDCNIWNGDAYKGYEKQCEIHGVEAMEKDKFISAIKLGNNRETNFIPDLTGYKLGDLGPIYGFQWRNWNGKTKDELYENYLKKITK
jgi:thymidylate synthase